MRNRKFCNEELNIYEKGLKLNEGSPSYVLQDGPHMLMDQSILAALSKY